MVISHTLFRRRLLFCGAKRSIISTADRRATFLALFHGHLLFWSGLRGRLFYRFFLTLFRDCFFFVRLRGRFFYRMVDDSLPQWIRTYPEEAAPRTGDGLFPGEVIEVTQVRERFSERT